MRTRIVMAALWLAFLPAASAQAQDDFAENTTPGDFKLQKVERVHLDDVKVVGSGSLWDAGLEIYLRALTRYGESVDNLHEPHFEVREDERKFETGKLRVQTLKESGKGITVVLAIDVSRTMTGEPFDRARTAALNFIDRLGALDRVAIVTFAGAPEVIAPFDMPFQKKRVILDNLEIDPNSLNTVLHDGVYRSVELIRQGVELPRRALVIVFSDGNDGGSNHDLEQVVQYAQGGPGEPGIPVFSIGYARFGGGGLDVLQDLSKRTGAGEINTGFFQATSTVHLNRFYGSILEQLEKSYVVYVPTRFDGDAHMVGVIIEGQKDEKGPIQYPPFKWPFLELGVGGGTLLLLLLLVLWLRRSRSPGKLVLVLGSQTGEKHRLRAGRTRVGALADNDVVLPSPKVSRYHAEVHAKGREVELEDLRSANGTYVNGMPIQRSPIRPGDRIRIGDVDMVYER